jgi:hypothetical protein
VVPKIVPSTQRSTLPTFQHFLCFARPETLPHLSGHFSMPFADAVAIGRHSEGKGRQIKACMGLLRVDYQLKKGVTI